jgi:hypothetical protein
MMRAKKATIATIIIASIKEVMRIDRHAAFLASMAHSSYSLTLKMGWPKEAIAVAET